MRSFLTLFAGVRGRGHVVVFHAFAEGLARTMMKRQPTARVRAVGS